LIALLLIALLLIARPLIPRPSAVGRFTNDFKNITCPIPLPSRHLAIIP
jgi:hypothetical protein